MWRVSPVYYYSLPYLNSLTQTALICWTDTIRPPARQQVTQIIHSLFMSLQRNLQQSHRLTFATNYSLALLEFGGHITEQDRFEFIHGSTSDIGRMPAIAVPETDWITDTVWRSICNLAKY